MGAWLDCEGTCFASRNMRVGISPRPPSLDYSKCICEMSLLWARNEKDWKG